MAYRHRKSSYRHYPIPTSGIKISEISKDVDEWTLRHHFVTFGKISSIFLKTSYPYNHAYVNYMNLADAKMAAATMNGCRIGQNAVKVKLQDDDSPTSQPFVQSKKYALKISNINPRTTQKRLSILFKTDVSLKEVSGKPSYAYANYDSEVDMKDALKFHDFLLDDFNIQVKLSKYPVDHSPLGQPSDSSYQDSTPHQFSVKISNINPCTTQEILTELFKTIVVVNIVEGGPNYGYANYASQVGMEYALSLHNKEVNDFKIQVRAAKGKTRSVCLQYEQICCELV